MGVVVWKLDTQVLDDVGTIESGQEVIAFLKSFVIMIIIYKNISRHESVVSLLITSSSYGGSCGV